jgi:probable rRNA maturation factor
MPRMQDSGPLALLLFRHSSRRVQRTPLRVFLGAALQRIAPGRAVTCLITTDEELRELNQRFRGKNYSTDVLSFPSPQGSAELGEMAISFDRASEQATAQGHSVDQELRILVLHGLLHLSGMDHETDSGEMARAERAWRKRLGLPSGLIERNQNATPHSVAAGIRSAKSAARTAQQTRDRLTPHAVPRRLRSAKGAARTIKQISSPLAPRSVLRDLIK